MICLKSHSYLVADPGLESRSLNSHLLLPKNIEFMETPLSQCFVPGLLKLMKAGEERESSVCCACAYTIVCAYTTVCAYLGL